MRTPSFSRVLYVTGAENDRYFIPVNSNNHGGGTPTMAEQVNQCNELVSEDDDGDDLGVPVQASSLAAWS
tara:strand:+ start:185 stop:394 length:210 start_codon:yes stop_codon:yes gene_type:complete